VPVSTCSPDVTGTLVIAGCGMVTPSCAAVGKSSAAHAVHVHIEYGNVTSPIAMGEHSIMCIGSILV
jgi:hypothetical protein